MSLLCHSIQVAYELQVHFTHHVFDPANLVLADVLDAAPRPAPRQVLLVLDEALAQARPELSHEIEAYFAAHATRLNLVCSPVVIEGGERTKNSYFHVSEIHSHIDRYHLDRHSYVVAVGGAQR